MATERTEVDIIVKAIAEGFGKMGGEIGKIGAAQDKLALSVLKSEAAQKKLAAAELAVSKNADPGKQNKLTQSMLKARIAADQAKKETKEYAAALAQLKKASSAAEKGSSGLRKTLSGFTLSDVNAGMALAGRGLQVLKSGFDSLKEGAAAKQTAQSFEFLINKVGGATDTLEQLRQASRGTIDDQTLMASTLTLTAGAGDDLAKRLFDAAPQLAKIAKASNKLNPALGDTAFLMESLGRGVKRASPLILDNLGLTIKIGAAEKVFAESIGKTVAQLSAEEKQIALLNDVLRAGDTLISQVGGNVDAAGDSLARTEVKINNFVTNIKVGFAALVTAGNETNETLISLAQTGNIFEKAGATMEILGTSAKRLEEAWIKNREEMLAMVDAGELTIDQFNEYSQTTLEAAQRGGAFADATDTVAAGFGKLSEELLDAIALGEELEDSDRKLLAAQATLRSQTETELIPSIDDTSGRMQTLILTSKQASNALLGIGGSAEELAEGMKNLGTIVGGAVGKEQQKFAESQGDLTAKAEELRAKLAELGGEHGTLVSWQNNASLSADELIVREGKLATASAKAAEAQQALSENTDPEAQQALAVALASANIAVENAAGKLPSLGQAYVDNADDIAELEGELEGVIGAIDANAAAHEAASARIIFSMAQQRVAVDGVTTEEAALLGQLAMDLDLWDQATADAVAGVNRAFDEVDAGNLEAAREIILDVADAAAALDGTQINIGVNISQQGVLPGGVQAGRPAAAFQHGANFIVPPGFPHSAPGGGLPILVESGEHVQITPKGQVGQGGGITINGGLTVVANDAAGGRAAGQAFIEQAEEYLNMSRSGRV